MIMMIVLVMVFSMVFLMGIKMIEMTILLVDDITVFCLVIYSLVIVMMILLAILTTATAILTLVSTNCFQ